MEYDVIIVGSGPGGYVTAVEARRYGLKTAIVEKGEYGGVCLNVGCIPTKTLLKSAKINSYIDHASDYGVNVGAKTTIDWKMMQNRKNDVVKKLTGGIGSLMKSYGVDVLIGEAKAVDTNTIVVVDKNKKEATYKTKNLIIATGSSVRMFDAPNGPEGMSNNDLGKNKHLLTSTEILSLQEVPKELVIIGGGVIGIEFACMFQALNTKVTVIEFQDQILGLSDLDVSITMKNVLSKKGIKIITGHAVAKLEGNNLTYYKADDKAKKTPYTISADYFLLSTGRKSTTAGFENLGIQIKPNQAFAVNNKMEALTVDNTVIPNVFVIGDANGERMLAHVASAQGIAVIHNVALSMNKPSLYRQKNPETIDYNKLPSCIYSFPEVSNVGMTEKEVKAQYKGEYIVKKKAFATNGKALADGETDGFVKLIVGKTHGEILGCHIVASNATELIADVTSVLMLEGLIFDLAKTVHPHPTLSEVIMDVAQDVIEILGKKEKDQ